MSNILIVDDDPTIRMMFARALHAQGDIEQAANGGDALRLLSAKKYTVILLDLHMPVIDGFVILQMLSTKPGPNRETPIYVITADVSDQARIRALRRHAVFFLTKPVPIATLVALVDSTIKKAAQRLRPVARRRRRDAPLAARAPLGFRAAAAAEALSARPTGLAQIAARRRAGSVDKPAASRYEARAWPKRR
jgi:CheY-like chemotaxis protein